MSKFISIFILVSFTLIFLPEKVEAAYYSADLKKAINNECKKSVKEKKYSTKNECVKSIKSALEAQGIVSVQQVPNKEDQEYIEDICVFEIKLGALKYNECIYKAVNKILGIETETIEPPVLRKNIEKVEKNENDEEILKDDEEKFPVEVAMPKDLVKDLLEDVQEATFYVELAIKSTNEPIGRGSAVHIGDGLILTNCHVVTNYTCRRMELFEEMGFPDDVISLLTGEKNLETCYQNHGYTDDLSINIISVLENASDPKNENWFKDVPIIKEEILTDRCILDAGSNLKNKSPDLEYFENIKINDTVYAVGNPRGYIGKPTEGKITMKYNYPPPAMTDYEPWLKDSKVKYIETDAAIDKGNSGGGLYTKGGKLIGITSSCKVLGGPEVCYTLPSGEKYCDPYCNLKSPQNWSIPVEAFLEMM